MDNNNVVKNASEGYGYTYASLGDIAKQGFKIPKMKTGTEEGRDFVYFLDGDEWVRGAEIVIPESKQMNKAQLYGSALTYARRYTTLMALQLACDDDKEVEDTRPDGTKKNYKPQPRKEKVEVVSTSVDDIINDFRLGYSDTDRERIRKHNKVDRDEDIPVEKLNQYVKDRRGIIEKKKLESDPLPFDFTEEPKDFY